MTGRLYRVLRYRIVLVGIGVLAGVAVAVAPARAASPRPVAASSIQVIRAHPARVVAQPAPLTIDQLEGMLAQVVGIPIVISCDQPGVPSPIDGHTVDPGDDGTTFTGPDGRITNVVHVSVVECSEAEQANRHRDPMPKSYRVYLGKRVDTISAYPFLILLHESFHSALNSSDEGAVECDTISNAWPLVAQLHLPAWEASMMLAGMAARHASWLPGSVYRTVC